MILFVLINYPYYKMIYGSRARAIIQRTILLNALAICIGWIPVVKFWPEFSSKFLLSAAGIIGALACASSRFIYREVIPEELGKTLLELLERKRGQDEES